MTELEKLRAIKTAPIREQINYIYDSLINLNQKDLEFIRNDRLNKVYYEMDLCNAIKEYEDTEEYEICAKLVKIEELING